MLINMTNVLADEGKFLETECKIEMDLFESSLGDFPILRKEPLIFRASNVSPGKAQYHGTMTLELQLACDRCLREVSKLFELNFSGVISAPEKDDEEHENSEFMEGYSFNIESLVNNEVLMNWPMKVLCSNDCKGICMKCGKDLNSGMCECDTFIPDPRMAMIKDIFNANNKEV